MVASLDKSVTLDVDSVDMEELLKNHNKGAASEGATKENEGGNFFRRWARKSKEFSDQTYLYKIGWAETLCGQIASRLNCCK